MEKGAQFLLPLLASWRSTGKSVLCRARHRRLPDKVTSSTFLLIPAIGIGIDGKQRFCCGKMSPKEESFSALASLFVH
ncbi:hypothetical protein M441DRAFT_363655 [Trichoderma asperellum CBS 433.97]|uniref:Uncharacterized protein n=1 Tax=Trichoderma asperellum (strain ATCC 204424 / CBS 433.97 / NBRC 101777) TaxID=1042311 RepID=A0A2T3ZE12_TRIA4|nr:hypothetical protein M441DRAFT_363655 [Trichoderma asperellum CBS 433.97]PTB43024.1 hypothetical protein M441DRAFT_363655 [Trichoderma asperellum CBS 433.97]